MAFNRPEWKYKQAATFRTLDLNKAVRFEKAVTPYLCTKARNGDQSQRQLWCKLTKSHRSPCVATTDKRVLKSPP